MHLKLQYNDNHLYRRINIFLSGVMGSSRIQLTSGFGSSAALDGSLQISSCNRLLLICTWMAYRPLDSLIILVFYSLSVNIWLWTHITGGGLVREIYHTTETRDFQDLVFNMELLYADTVEQFSANYYGLQSLGKYTFSGIHKSMIDLLQQLIYSTSRAQIQLTSIKPDVF